MFREDILSGEGGVLVHVDLIADDGIAVLCGVHFSNAAVAISEGGVVVTQTDIHATIDLFLEDDTEASVEARAPTETIVTVHGVHIGLEVEGTGDTDTPIAPKTILRILGNLGLSKGTACKCEKAEQCSDF